MYVEFEELDSILPPSGRETIIDHTQVTPRDRCALEIFDALAHQPDVDPLEA